ncbi:hypothetical protein GCM10009776_29770 [Microbacterium deminutum]|uniref:Uncharacterized protein n=1 Tax=Microbacterium deminutum TaxID=344164 RepID=A0ABN2R909_9MICO
MMHMTATGITTPDGGFARAFAVGTGSFGAFQNGRAHTAI